MYRHIVCMSALSATILFASPLHAQDEKNSRKVGKFPMAKVIDGDTIRVEVNGHMTSLRLLGIDTEECFHDGNNRRQKEAFGDFEKYVERLQKGALRPTKYPTPFGEAARQFAIKFFENVKEVEVENDDPNEKTGHFGRMLSYVFVIKNGKRVHYNAEIVRLGFSPYYVKYGRSRSYEKEFQAAEKEARAAKRGVWGQWKTTQCYPDYPKRLKWWSERASILDQWRQRNRKNLSKPEKDRELLISLNDANGLTELTKLKGKTVTIFGTIDRIRHPASRGSIVVLSAKRARVDCHSADRIHDGGTYNREFAIIKGTVVRHGKYTNLERAKLLVPAIKTSSIKPNDKSKPSPKKMFNDAQFEPKKDIKSFVFKGEVRDALKSLKNIFKVNLVIGPLGAGYRTVVDVSLKSVAAGQAIEAVAVAANLQYHRISPLVHVVRNADQRKALTVKAEERLLWLIAQKSPLAISDRQQRRQEIEDLISGLSHIKGRKPLVKRGIQRNGKKAGSKKK
jgi:endonuclease YncB( thermonuclease family)